MDAEDTEAGCEILAVARDARFSDGRAPRMTDSPREPGAVEADGVRVGVRYELTGRWVHIVFPTARRAACELVLVTPTGERVPVDGIAALDALDRQRRRRLSSVLASLPDRSTEDLSRAVRAALVRVGDGRSGLSPAARALLKEMLAADERDAAVLHSVALLKRGREPIVRELVDAGLVIALEHGHLIPRERYERLVAAERPASPAEAAEVWGCSRGRARAILRLMGHDGAAS